MVQKRLIDLVPDLVEADVASDTGRLVINVDPATNPVAGEARTFSLKQIHDLFNVLLRRSQV